jgi:hypothetical protein
MELAKSTKESSGLVCAEIRSRENFARVLVGFCAKILSRCDLAPIMSPERYADHA